jgi:hypothetical protein
VTLIGSNFGAGADEYPRVVSYGRYTATDCVVTVPHNQVGFDLD